MQRAFHGVAVNITIRQVGALVRAYVADRVKLSTQIEHCDTMLAGIVSQGVAGSKCISSAYGTPVFFA